MWPKKELMLSTGAIMDEYRVSVVAIVLLCSASAAHGCENLTVGIPNATCYCEDIDEGNFRGWNYACLGETHPFSGYMDPFAVSGSLPILFELKYKINKDGKRTIELQCGNNETNFESIFQQIDTNTETYIFKSCPLQNILDEGLFHSYENNKLRELKIENAHDNQSFSAELFEPISKNLKTLFLIKNYIKELPENLFTNFSDIQYLSLSDNLLKTLPERIFDPLPQLTSLEVTNNLLESLPENIFNSLFQLKRLFLYKNKLKKLPNTIFRSLLNLQVLDLADNHLVSLDPDIFLGLSQVENIRLRGNWLRTLPPELFRYTLNIKEIDLSINRFMEPLPESLLYGLSRLDTFKIQDCNISYIDETFFSYSLNITNLQLESNRLKELPGKIFQNNTMLKELNLNYNKIEILQEDLLLNQKYLEKLFLYENNITVIPKPFFKNTISLKILVLGKNNLKEFSQNMCRNLPNLESIDLSKNKLTSFTLDDLNREIRYVALSYNKITKMPPLRFENHLKLEALDLEYNKIAFLKVPVMYGENKKNPTINIAHNNITTVDISEILFNDYHLSQISVKDNEVYPETIVFLKSNPFSCDCKLYGFFQYLTQKVAPKSAKFPLIDDLICNEPPKLHSKPIRTLKSYQFSCNLNENCSSPCHCYYRIHDDSTIVNCSDNRLKEIPSIIPPNTNILDFKNNSLSSISALNNEEWSNLTEVYLDNNEISNINDWNIPSNLKILSLSGNRLRELPESFLNLTAEKEEFFVNLSRNPWTCNCSTSNFKTWLAEHVKNVPDATHVLCSQRLKQNGSLERVSVLSIADKIMCPLDEWPYRVQMITVATVCAILALSFLVVSVLYYRNKQTVIAYLYIHLHPFFICFFNEEEFDEDKIFDAFVAYGHDDCDVAHRLIDELEPHFQLCIHERNWIAGNQISWNIFNSVHNSRRTILVISKQFLESMWFRVEFHTAYYQMLEDKIDRLIIIVKGELPPKETLDKELLYLLSTKTYLIWEEKWFWEKLRYAMPHKKTQAIQSDVLALKDKPDREKIKAVDNQIAILSANSLRTTDDKDQDVVQNGTSTVNLVSDDVSPKR